jgi:hypothetical protein
MSNYPDGMEPARKAVVTTTCKHCGYSWPIVGMMDLGVFYPDDNDQKCLNCQLKQQEIV